MKQRSPDYAFRRSELESQIGQLFPMKPVPGENETVPYTRHLDLERNAIRAFLNGKSWDLLTLDALVNGYRGDASAILNFASTIGFLYYYPAFLLHTLNDFTTCGRMSTHSSFYAFTNYERKAKARLLGEMGRITRKRDLAL